MADKILAQLKKMGAQFLEWWKKFARRQQIVIISVAVGVILALIILVNVLNRPKYTFLISADTSSAGAEVRDILDDAGVPFRVSDDGRTFYVKKGHEANANLALGSEGYETDEYADLNSVLSGGFSTTEADKQKKYVKYLSDRIKRDLKVFDFVKDATVILDVPQDDGTLIARNLEASAAITLTLRDDISIDTAQRVAKFVATALGNSSTEKITIMDSTGTLYFAGADDTTIAGAANSQVSVMSQINNMVRAEVTNVLVGMGEFGSISVAPRMQVDFSTGEESSHRYESQLGDDSSESIMSEKTEYNAESNSGEGGVPGTTNNTDDTSYVIGSGGEQSSTESEVNYKYLPDEYMSHYSIPAGRIDVKNSSIAITTVKYNVIKEADAKRKGLLDDVSWEDYKILNSGKEKLTIDEDWKNTVSMATGIPIDKISFVAYMENWFVDREGFSVKTTDVVTIILILLILGLLGFVLIRSMKSLKQQEQEEELSVESLLQSTQETPIENIEVEEKSDARRSIEKFVEENPDAVANLLRNWLNEDWGAL